MLADRVSALAITALLGAATLAQAQTPPSPPPAPPGAHHWDGADMRARWRARQVAHLKALHDVLGIRPDQEAAFQAYAAALHPAHSPGAAGWREPDAGGMAARPVTPPMTAPERVDAMLKRQDERSARMHEALQHRADATRSFYAALSPAQQRAMDALPELAGRDRMGRGGWGGRGGDGKHGPMMDHGPHGPGHGDMGAGE